MAERTLYTMFQETVQRYGSRPAVGFKVGKSPEITYWTYSELDTRVRAMRRGLDALGVRKGDRVALLTENRVEWAIADLAIQALGAINVSLYPSLPAGQVAYVLRDCGAKILILSDAEQRKKVSEIRKNTSDLRIIVGMEGEADQIAQDSLISLEEVTRMGKQRGREDAELDALIPAIHPDDLATFIYTSGTTGDPKGAMLTHRNLLHTPDAVVEEPIAHLGPEDVFLSFLPLSHITERIGGHYLPLRIGACIIYSQGLRTVGEEITTTVRPTAMLCVPRLFESMHSKFKDALAKAEEDRRKKAEWALAIGIECAKRKFGGQGVGPILMLKHLLAEKLILSKIREKVTGGRMRFIVSGGAPLDPEIATFFLAIGVNILEGYGLSETGIIAVNRPGRQRIGTVGNLLPHVEMRLAEDGEILMRGQGRMVGYNNKPEETAEAIDADGWFHTGDIGEYSTDGYLKITDRKKDLIVLTNGKKVAPQPIEAQLKHSHYIGEAVLFGDKQSTVMALLVPEFGNLLAWAKSKEMPTKDVEALLAHPDVQKLYRAEIDQSTPGLAEYERVKRFKLVAKPFSIEGGELTPTLKVKRKFVAQKYADLIAAMAR